MVKAFTLIELLVVVAIIGILAAVGVVSFSNFTVASKVVATKANYKLAEKTMLAIITACGAGVGYQFKNPYYGNCSTYPKSFFNGDTMAQRVQQEIMDNVKNPYNSTIASTDWSNGSCPPPNPPKGQIIIGYGYNNNTCGMPGNISCVKANIGDIGGNDVYLSQEFNLCLFK